LFSKYEIKSITAIKTKAPLLGVCRIDSKHQIQAIKAKVSMHSITQQLVIVNCHTYIFKIIKNHCCLTRSRLISFSEVAWYRSNTFKVPLAYTLLSSPIKVMTWFWTKISINYTSKIWVYDLKGRLIILSVHTRHTDLLYSYRHI
jgi:hypothetical protein